MKNNTLTLFVLVVIVAIGILSYSFYSKKNVSPVNNPPMGTDSLVLYKNSEYGFTFSLPDSWKGYSVVENVWKGSPLATTSADETGPKLLMRNPKWTEALPYQDIPILIFTLKQWDSYTAENFSVSAAPFPASELARNNMYVFALPPRWNFDYSEGYAEAENIVKSNPLKTFNIEPPVFTWKFENAESLNLDGMPNTNVYLEVAYSGGGTQKKLIDTTPGGCNMLPDNEKDSVQNSSDIQCYSAGLGSRFKITKGKESYLVMRKMFEEALPNHTPPNYKYEVVSELPFFN